jgi:hypothetical protein
MSRKISNGIWLWVSACVTVAIVLGIWGGPARAEDAPTKPTQPVFAQAAEFVQVDNLPWCIEASKIALQLATGAVAENWDTVTTAKHINFGDEPEPESENIYRAMFALLFATDIHNALAYVASNPATPVDEYATRATQVILESCAYQYGKNVAGK